MEQLVESDMEDFDQMAKVASAAVARFIEDELASRGLATNKEVRDMFDGDITLNGQGIAVTALRERKARA